MTRRYRTAKRILDLGISTVLLLVTAPLQALTAIAIKISMGSPVLFRQVRPGLNCEPFTLYKFRTMLTPEEAAGRTDDAVRLTRLGQFLRSTSIDELPSLWNVIRGDMSLVGPRPLLIEYLDLYTPEQLRRHLVKPGLTGLAQVMGRNGLSWEDKLLHDLAYVEHCSFSGDLTILMKTIGQVIKRQGVSAPGHVTMPRLGNPVVDESTLPNTSAVSPGEE